MNYIITNKNFLGRRVEFIKALRAAFPLGLSEAVDIVDKHFPSTRHGVAVHTEVPELPQVPRSPYELRYIQGDPKWCVKKEHIHTVTYDTSITSDLKALAKKAIEEEDYSVAITLIQLLR